MIGAVAAAGGIGTLVSAIRKQRALLAGALAGLCLVDVGLALVVAVVTVATVRFRRAAGERRLAEERSAAAVESLELVALGLAGGLSIAAAWELAAHHAPASIRVDLEEMVSRMGRVGAAEALTADEGPTAGGALALASAAAAGSPALPALHSYLDTEHHRRHEERVERLRRLPVRLLVPLTLLVLPGFVVMTVGPTLIDSLARLSPLG